MSIRKGVKKVRTCLENTRSFILDEVWCIKGNSREKGRQGWLGKSLEALNAKLSCLDFILSVRSQVKSQIYNILPTVKFTFRNIVL